MSELAETMKNDSPGTRFNHRILIVDDTPAIHQDFLKILRPEQPTRSLLEEDEAAIFNIAPEPPPSTAFEIDSAYQGEEALRSVERALADGRPYSVAFVDVRMPPGWDGIETVVRLWKVDPQLQVVVCTAHADYRWDEITRLLSPSDNLVILKKPFDNIEVLQLAHALSKKWLFARQAREQLESLDDLVRQRTHDLTQANSRLVREVEARTRTEAALRESEVRFEQAFRANPLAMAIQNRADERYIDVNDRFETLTGLRREAVVNRTPAELPRIFEEGVLDRARQELLERGRARDVQGSLLEQPNAARHEVTIWVEPLSWGDRPATLVIVQDISERARLERELRQAQRIEAVGQLAAGVAHDFNNLLTVIQGHATLRLSADRLDQEVRESFQEVSAAADRAARLTRQLLAFGRRQELRRQALDLNSLAGRVCEKAARTLGPGVHLAQEYSPSPVWLHADEAQLEQVVLHLLSNARDAMPQGGQLTLRTAVMSSNPATAKLPLGIQAGDYARLTVSDTGAGMDAATIDRLFEPFFTTKEFGQGSGMGLAMVYGVVRQHEGWIDVKSEPHRGSTFEIFLPVMREQPAGTPTPAPRPNPPPAARLFVVEDEPAVRLLVERVLTRAGYEVIGASDGVEALDVWRREEGRFDLLLTDVVMPRGLSGKRLAQILQSENPRLKLILTSGHNGATIGEESGLREGYNLLSKPYVIQALLDAVRTRLAE